MATISKHLPPDRYMDLAQQTIVQALADVRGYSHRARDWDGKCRREAMAWFNERSTKPFGYGWCLEVSGMNPNAIRDAINKYTNGRNK